MDVPQYTKQSLRLLERRHEYGDVYTYVFQPEDTVSYIPGHYGHLRLFGMPESEKAVREFSFASAPYEKEICFGIDSRSGSPYQKALLALPLGGVAELFKIKSHMEWPPKGGRLVMIAGGVGVTPFRSMLLDLSRAQADIKALLIHASRDGFLYEKEFSSLPFDYVRTSRAELPAALNTAITANPDAPYYVAGSPGFVEAVINTLSSAGILKIQSDPFKGLSE